MAEQCTAPRRAAAAGPIKGPEAAAAAAAVLAAASSHLLQMSGYQMSFGVQKVALPDAGAD
jgi:hypothetical protein